MAPLQGDVEPNQFVNPYTFASFPKDAPDGGWRRAPAGHAKLPEGRLSGTVRVEITARSPLLLRNVYADEDGVFPRRRVPGFAGDVPYIPGSSLAGSVRSLHETIAGGCLRIFDEAFLPGYRDQPASREKRYGEQRGRAWRLARVDDVDDAGRPTRLEVCGKETWVESSLLRAALGGGGKLRTGERVELVTPHELDGFGRQVLKGEGCEVRSGGNHVVLVADWGARKTTRQGTRTERNNAPRGKTLPGRYFCAAAPLPEEPAHVTVTDEAWLDYLGAVEHSRDMQEERIAAARDDSVDVWVPVHFEGSKAKQLLAQRKRARRELEPGDVIWVLPAEDDATEISAISLAVMWRHGGGVHPAGARLPENALLPCADPDDLCPSCRLFGSADVSGADGEAARQRAYRGHVRFSDGVPVEPCETTLRRLPAMGTPRPGNGHFYLTRVGGTSRDGGEGAVAKQPTDPPLREWGSAMNHRPGRKLRGRKQYWLTGTPDERPFFRATAGDDGVFHRLAESENGEGSMLSSAESVPVGTRFTFTVTFDGLTEVEFGGLLSALQPDLLLRRYVDTPDVLFGWAVGGGRPLGFGTCTSTVRLTDVRCAKSRYLGGDEAEVETPTAVEAFVRTMPKEQRRLWKQELTKTLRLDWAPADRVWYPPAGVLAGPDGRLNAEALRPGYAFWQQTTGAYTESGKKKLRQLPSADSPSPGMDVITDDKGPKKR